MGLRVCVTLAHVHGFACGLSQLCPARRLMNDCTCPLYVFRPAPVSFADGARLVPESFPAMLCVRCARSLDSLLQALVR